MYPFPLPSDEAVHTCFKQPEPDCSLTSCCDEKSKFHDQGKLNADEIFAAFEQSIKNLKKSKADWLTVFNKSIETCKEISEQRYQFDLLPST
jgi:hypothetical protein